MEIDPLVHVVQDSCSGDVVFFLIRLGVGNWIIGSSLVFPLYEMIFESRSCKNQSFLTWTTWFFLSFSPKIMLHCIKYQVAYQGTSIHRFMLQWILLDQTKTVTLTLGSIFSGCISVLYNLHLYIYSIVFIIHK